MPLPRADAIATRAHGWLDGRWAVSAAAVLSALSVLAVWGSLAPVPVMHDEWAYWMQADQYAHLRWSVPAPVIPEFFEQFYVLVSPVYAAKYPPGHALTISAGFALGIPALVPLLLTAATGSLLFTLARRLASAPVAALTWILWIGTFGNLRFRASYFSELTTSTCWLLAWWSLLQWRSTEGVRRSRWMLVLAATVGWGAITRPATMFVFAIPVGVVVLRDVLSRQRWRDLALGMATGMVALAVLPVWSHGVTGSWSETPLARYTRQYLPFDTPGMKVSTVAAERELPPEMERTRTFLRDLKEDQASAPIFRTVAERGAMVLRDAFGEWRFPFAVAFLLGLASLSAAGWLALGTSVLLLLAYGMQAHTADWIVYYLETLPVVAFVAAVGTARLFARLAPRAVDVRVAVLLAVIAALLLGRDVMNARETLDRIAATPRRFRAAVAMLPRAPNIVFVRYADRRSMHIALVANDGILSAARSWIVHDRDGDNGQLLQLSPARAAYLFDEASGEFREMRR